MSPSTIWPRRAARMPSSQSCWTATPPRAATSSGRRKTPPLHQLKQSHTEVTSRKKQITQGMMDAAGPVIVGLQSPLLHHYRQVPLSDGIADRQQFPALIGLDPVHPVEQPLVAHSIPPGRVEGHRVGSKILRCHGTARYVAVSRNNL